MDFAGFKDRGHVGPVYGGGHRPDIVSRRYGGWRVEWEGVPSAKCPSVLIVKPFRIHCFFLGMGSCKP